MTLIYYNKCKKVEVVIKINYIKILPVDDT